MGNREIWEKFVSHQKSGGGYLEGCHGCPHGEKYQVGEALPRNVWSAYRDHPNFRDGKMWHDEVKPIEKSLPCQACFEGWIAEVKQEGKICIKCGNWVKAGSAGMDVEEREVESKKMVSKAAVCMNCLTGGKSPEEWAEAMVAKAKKAREARK